MHNSKSKFMLGVAFVAALSVPATVVAGSGSRQIEIITLSTNGSPHLVTGGDVLVALVVPDYVPMDQVQVRLNGNDITSAFRVDPVTGQLTGLVTGLRLGNNNLGVRGGSLRSRVTLVNHPITGPLFSGPHQTPFVCEAGDFVLPVTGATLGPVLDAECSTATRVDYVYRSTDGTFKPLPDPTERPADLARTTTNEGQTLPYIVRAETGTINRAIYQIVFLHEPGQPLPDPWARSPGWNGKLIYLFGGGCRPGYHQGTFFQDYPPPTGRIQGLNPLNDAWLSQGYAVAVSSLNLFYDNCNDVVSAETMMMVKEHFTEEFGLPRYTMGWGASGGSMQQHLIAHNYPGLLDGITPSSSFPDALTFYIPISDCPLLKRAFDGSTENWTIDQKRAVAGWGTWDFCTTQISSDWALLVKAGPTPPPAYSGCAPTVPTSLIYDPVTNPGGARCTYQDNAVNIFSRDPSTGFARRPLDNVGLQYGLNAFNAGQISPEQFVQLNELVGGYDIDGNMIVDRMVADRAALRIAYQTGRLDTGSGGLGSVPIIDFRAYRDDIPDPHDSVRSHITRARLIAANGNADNQVILVGSPDGIGPGSTAAVAADVLRLMDEWLINIGSDVSPYQTLAQKVVRNKPAELVDACYTLTGEKMTDQSICRGLYPLNGNPRLAAGGPLTNDVLKCALKPLDATDYAQPLTADQLARLNAVFPEGVCDYSRPGVEQQLVTDTWLLYFSDFW